MCVTFAATNNTPMNYSKVIYFLAIAACALPFVDTPIALLAGIIFAQVFSHPFPKYNKKATTILLQFSVVGLGFGMNAMQALEAGKQGFLFTVFSIISTLVLGLFIGKWLKVEKETSYLISTGTAICGGSAIAAISSILKSNERQISAALGTIFILNSVALFIFPWIGHLLSLTQQQFGVWSAIAIHDTSSVVGAAAKYGNEALKIATTIKLERALWIIPLSIVTVLLFKKELKSVKIPYFIFLFVLATLITTFFPAIRPMAAVAVVIAKIGLKITLFLIGSGLSRAMVLSVGAKPLVQGVILWVFISIISLTVVMLTVI